MRSLHPAIRAALDTQSYKIKLAAARASLGVTAVAVNQLFPTPKELAERLVDEAHLEAGQRILEPQAGTASILRAIDRSNVQRLQVVAVEIDPRLADHLRQLYGGRVEVICADFLRTHSLGLFDRIVTNPPFRFGDDIRHMAHALPMLAPRGRLIGVALDDGQAYRPELCGEDGYGRRAAHVQELRHAVEAAGRIMRVTQLPPGIFKSQGTGVRTVLVVIE